MSTPSSAADHYRDIKYDAAWEKDLTVLRNGAQAPAAIDEVISEIEPILARLCEDYELVNGTDFRVMNIVAARGLPKLQAWFQIESDECVCCYRLEAAVENEEDDDSDEEDYEE